MLSNIAYWHPQIVHFAIALLFAGVIFRLISLTGKLAFTSATATSLVLAGTVAAFLAVISGEKAHGPVERIPGAGEAVEEHEEHGERARNIFIAVALLEIGVFATTISNRRRPAKVLALLAGVVGVGGLFFLYEAAEHGGALVYEYGGGPGLRSGDPEHIERLLVAGLYNQAMVARREKRGEEAAHLLDELTRLRPNETSVKMLVAESQLRDRNDPGAALTLLSQIQLESPRQKTQREMLRAEAFHKLGSRDSANAIMDALVRENPENRRIKAKADSLRSQ